MRRSHAERGVVLPLVAMVMTVLVLFASMAIDLGYQRVARRDMQALADVVALDLARDVDGRTAAQILADPGWTADRNASVARNSTTAGDAPTVTAELGVVDQSTGVFTAVAGVAVPDSVRVTASNTINFFFRPGTGAANRVAVASQVPRANFMIGSFLAGTDPDLDLELLDRVLPRRIGSALDRLTATTAVGLTAVSYQGLANSQVDLRQLGAELGVGSPDQLVGAGAFNARNVYLATASVMDRNGNTAGATVFRAMAAEVDNTATIDFGDVFLQQGGASQLGGGTNVSVGGLAFLNSTVTAIDGNNLVSIPNLNLGIPGITSTALTLELIEAPQYCEIPNNLCNVGDSVSTSQVRVGLVNTLSLVPSLALVDPSMTGTLTTQTVAAGATGVLTAARCSAGTGIQGIDVAVASQPITTTASESLTVQATVLGLAQNVATVSVTNQSRLASGTGGVASFAFPSEFLPTAGTGGTKRIGSPSLQMGAALDVTASNVTLAELPLGLTSAVVANAVNLAVAPVITSLENFVVRRLARTLGLYLGGADVGAVDLQCGGVGLVG